MRVDLTSLSYLLVFICPIHSNGGLEEVERQMKSPEADWVFPVT